jgi:uncharacterized hydantoinase/oxoprolinase family protein
MHDVYLILDSVPENPADCDTADGRPATKSAAHARLARMLCADLETTAEWERRGLAELIAKRQITAIHSAISWVKERISAISARIISAGSGSFLLSSILDVEPRLAVTERISMQEQIGAAASSAACAYAVAVLAKENSNAR